MKVLFLTILRINDIKERGLYNDLLRAFYKNGHEIYVVSPIERRNKKDTFLNQTKEANILNVKTLNIQKTNLIEKGLGSLLIEYQFLRAIKKYFSDIKFDLVLYSTPPITFGKIIKYIKQKDNAFSYLLLKDIFPQNAVDLGFMKKGGFLYRFFRKKEIELYKMSDKIGCMSPANVRYILEHNPYLDKRKVEVCPNSIEPVISLKNENQTTQIKKRFNIPINSIVFIYGGNLGKPQGIDFLIDVLDSNKDTDDYYFLVVGDGTEYGKIEKWFNINKSTNAQLIKNLPKDEYDKLLMACDVGMIFLDKRFTIPNFPSRLLSYMENNMPIVAATDRNTDLKETIEQGQFGFWSESGSIKDFNQNINKFINRNIITERGRNAFQYLKRHYTSQISYEIILKNTTQIEASRIEI